MDSVKIHYMLDLVIRLIDTTTGSVIMEKDVRFQKDGIEIHPVPRENGSYIFLNMGRNDMDVSIQVYGFEPVVLPVRYEDLDCFMPLKDVFLIPSENTVRGEPILSLTGTLPNLQAIDAVRLGLSYCSMKSYDAKKQLITLFKANGPSIEEIDYGVINTVKMTYEPFSVEKLVSRVQFKIRKPLQEDFCENAPITRVVKGSVTPKGEYLLRVRDNAAQLKYLIRFKVNDTLHYQVIDFHQVEELVI